MIKNERTPQDVLDDLIQSADSFRMFCQYSSGERGDEARSKDIGELVLGLPESDREILKQITSNDVDLQRWVKDGWRFHRPKEPVKRVREKVISLKK